MPHSRGITAKLEKARGETLTAVHGFISQKKKNLSYVLKDLK